MLTPEQIDLAIQQHVDPVATYGRVHNFARAIEAEVHKQDDALIRQMLESMCWAARVMTISEDEAPGYFAAITAAKERLRDYRLPE